MPGSSMLRPPFLHLYFHLLVLVLLGGVQPIPPHSCHDPDVGGTTQNKARRFVLFGSPEPEQGAGIGNLLIYFPALYYFAAFTGRDIIISDKSIIGEMCRIITCGFPFASEMALAFPAILGKGDPYSLKKSVEMLGVTDFIRYMEGTRKLRSNGNVIYAFGYKSESAWWQYFNTTVHCVSKLTGCDLGDVSCADRHAFQRLVRGPFKASLTAAEEKRIHGVPDNVKHAILTLPHAFAPRLDAAVHIRNSFVNFERQTDINDPDYKKEVTDWLNSTECAVVFQELETKLIEQLTESRGALNATSADVAYVYLAADNENVKDAFAERVGRTGRHPFTVRVMRVETKFIVHVKNLAKMKAMTANEGLLDLIFDWYALSLANIAIAWRQGSTRHISTFVHSAQRVSGTTERTNPDAAIGHGIGTRGFQLLKDRTNKPRFELIWSYPFLEPYQLPKTS